MAPRQRKSVPKIIKDLTWQRWIGDDIAKAKCLCCGVNEIKMNSFHCGHVISEADGGPTTVDNLRPVCATCNLSMRTQNMEKFKGQHSLGVTPNSFIIEDGNIRASARLGSTDLSISLPISTVIKTMQMFLR